jgi:hypothetical protein
MKNILSSVYCIFALLIVGVSQASAQVSDDFSDLNDTVNPTWTHLNGYVASTGQTWDASTGQYRMTAPNNGASSLGFVGSYAGAAVNGDVAVQSDNVSFVDLGNPPSGPIQGGVFGIAAKLNGLNGVAQLTGYAYLYEPFSDGGNGELVLARINPGVSVQDLGAVGVEGTDYVRKVTLDTNKDYTFKLLVTGGTLKGEVREVGTGTLVGYQTSLDPGTPYAGGFSGYVAYSQGPTTGNPAGFPPTDVTWDNFSSSPEPSTALLLVSGLGLMAIGRRKR